MPNTREKLIELLCNTPAPEVVVFGQRCGKALVTAEFIADHLIANGVTVQEWISVTERLPEEEGDYLIYATVPFNGRKFMAVMHYEKDAYLPIWSDTTHWMPLPEPPKGD